MAKHQLDETREKDTREAYKKADLLPKILVVTDKLLTGYGAGPRRDQQAGSGTGQG